MPALTAAQRVEFELDYSDNVRLAVDTRILVNFPRPRFAVLPVSLGLTLVKLHARVRQTASFSPLIRLIDAQLTLEIPPTSSPSPPVLYLSMHPDFTLDLSATSLIGSRAKLQDIPKVEQLIVGRLRSFVVEKLVYPKRIPLKLPAFSHHTGDDEDYVWVADATPDDFGLSQHSAAPSTDEAVDDEDDDEDLTAQLPQPDLDEVVRRPSPRSSPTMLTGGSATALPPRIFHYGSPAFRHRSSASSTISGSEPHLPGYLPRRPAPEPMRAMPPPWRAGEHILRAGSRAMPLPSPSFASGVSTPGFGTFASPVASR